MRSTHRQFRMAFALLLALLMLPVSGTMAASVLVEAESFAEKGGWVVDPQFADVMGSPFLMAHGLGKPVADAVTKVAIPEKGTYTVWVRTRNWAPGDWQAPGRFEVRINGKSIGEFGQRSGEWGWQKEGTVELSAGEATLALHDLTGFNGRCDAILLTTDPSPPPNDPKAIRPWRNRLLGMPDQPAKTESFDLVVVGGGIAGCAAAISAGEQGLKVALIHDRPTFGGNASGEVRVGMIGLKGREPARRILDALTNSGGNGSTVMLKDDEKRNAAMGAAKGVTLFRCWRAYDVAMDGKRIKAVHARHIETGECRSFMAPVFIDTTGDGWIGFWAGAEYRYGRESVKEFGEYHPKADAKSQTGHFTVMMPDLRNNKTKPNVSPESSNFPGGWSPQKIPNDAWSPENADQRVMGSSLLWSSAPAAGGAPQAFPEVPWATAVSKGVSASKSEWFWEFSRNDLNQIDDAEAIRDHLLRAAYGAFFTYNREKPGTELQWVAYILGKRESRRLMGDHIFTLGDIWGGRTFPDAVVEETRVVDLHYQTIEYPSGRQFPWNGVVDFSSWMLSGGKRPYTIPFRSLYSKNIENLMMAGRCFSCSHVAIGGPRIMNTTGQMGVAVGYAASLCHKHKTTPRGVYEKHLSELLGLTGFDTK